jgi:MerR family redox-sensitive transcriptional activator SoxR
MTIGEVARRAGLRASAIRFYEKAGLLPKAARAGGQRRYDGKILERLALVDFAKECGFTLAEIRQLFHGFRDNTPLSARMQLLAARKVQELDVLSGRIGIMKNMLARAQRCRCIDVDECGRRILAGAHKLSSDGR